MGFLHNLTHALGSETPKAELEQFLAQVPDGAVISTIVTTTPKDRPWESERTTVALQARWVTE